MESFLIFIKHHFNFLWNFLEWVNGLLFRLLYQIDLNKVLPDVFRNFAEPPFIYRNLEISDIYILNDLIISQKDSDLEYFRPHGFEIEALKIQLKKNAFLMMGVFEQERLVGYFFLRFFVNKKCFVGRLIDKEYRGRGIGLIMNRIMYETSWRMGFRCLSTISKKNVSVMKAHAKNPTMIIVKELRNDYLLVEFKQEAS